MSCEAKAQKPFDASQSMLRERLQFLLEELHPILKEDVAFTLKAPGKLFFIQSESINDAQLPSGVWSLLPLLIAQYVNPDIDKVYACNVAVAIECFVCALDMLDDIEDDDQTLIVKKLGIARVLNVSTTLLALTNSIFLSLVEIKISHTNIVNLLQMVQKSLNTATAGQHSDILAEQKSAESLTTEECIEIAAEKAGALMSLAFSIGALCANADVELLAQFSELGRLLGIAHQLDNDSHDLYHILRYQQTGENQGTVKTDIVRQKKTLPVVLAAHTLMTLQSDSSTTDEEKQRRFNDALHEGIITTWGISLLYRERAHDILRQIEVQRPISQELRLLLNFT